MAIYIVIGFLNILLEYKPEPVCGKHKHFNGAFPPGGAGRCVMCLFVICPLSHGSANMSTNQRTACVARTCLHPFRRISTPTEEYCKTSTAQYVSVRVTPTFGVGNAIRTDPLRIEIDPHLLLETRHNRAYIDGHLPPYNYFAACFCK